MSADEVSSTRASPSNGLNKNHTALKPRRSGELAATPLPTAGAALFAYEATNAIAKRVKRAQLTLEAAKQRLAALLENGPALEQDTGIHLRALEIMERFALPSADDAHYLALAETRCASAGPPMNVSEHGKEGAIVGSLGRVSMPLRQRREHRLWPPHLGSGRRSLAVRARRPQVLIVSG